MKRGLLFFTALVLSIVLCACGAEQIIAPGDPNITIEPEKGPTLLAEAQVIGISLPPEAQSHYQQDGAYIASQLVEIGFGVHLQHAEDTTTQAAHIASMLDNGCQVLIVAAIEESAALYEVLDRAAALGVQVIAYEHMIDHSGAVKYFIGFDHFAAGAMQGAYLRDALQLDTRVDAATIACIAGNGDARNTKETFAGAMSVLEPYFQSGKLVSILDAYSLERCATSSEQDAKQRAATLASLHASTPLDALYTTHDRLALYAAAAFEAQAQSPILLTGLGCEQEAVVNLIAGKQAMSIFQDNRILSAQAAVMATSLLKGDYVETNGAIAFSDESGAALAFYCAPVLVTIDNYEAVLLNSSYYEKADLGLAGEE